MSATQVKIGAELELTTETTGAGAPVVFIGGVGDDRHLFDPLAGRLAAQFECTTFDNRGVGASTPVEPGMTVADWADDAHELVRRLDRGPVAAVGCSMGSAIVQEWALRHPDDLTAIVLISTWSRRDEHMETQFGHWRELAAAGESERLGESISRLCGWAGWSPPALAGDGSATAPPATLVAQLDACLDHDTVGRLGAIGHPTLVLTGRHDQVVRWQHGTAVAAAIPAARDAVLPTGHVPFWEKPDECAALIASFAKASRSWSAAVTQR